VRVAEGVRGAAVGARSRRVLGSGRREARGASSESAAHPGRDVLPPRRLREPDGGGARLVARRGRLGHPDPAAYRGDRRPDGKRPRERCEDGVGGDARVRDGVLADGGGWGGWGVGGGGPGGRGGVCGGAPKGPALGARPAPAARAKRHLARRTHSIRRAWTRDSARVRRRAAEEAL